MRQFSPSAPKRLPLSLTGAQAHSVVLGTPYFFIANILLSLVTLYDIKKSLCLSTTLVALPPPPVSQLPQVHPALVL